MRKSYKKDVTMLRVKIAKNTIEVVKKNLADVEKGLKKMDLDKMPKDFVMSTYEQVQDDLTDAMRRLEVIEKQVEEEEKEEA